LMHWLDFGGGITSQRGKSSARLNFVAQLGHSHRDIHQTIPDSSKSPARVIALFSYRNFNRGEKGNILGEAG